MPPSVVIYGLEGRNFSPGSQLLTAVEEAPRRIAQEVSGAAKCL